MLNAKMESTTGQSGNSHPRHLVEQQREEYSKHYLLVCGLLCELLGRFTVFF